jgi:hypothetical protein
MNIIQIFVGCCVGWFALCGGVYMLMLGAAAIIKAKRND